MAATDQNSIDYLIEKGKIEKALALFKEFLDKCEESRDSQIQLQARISYLEDNLRLGISREGIQRNKITWDFLSVLQKFKKETISSYFDVRDKTSYFEQLSGRDHLIRDSLKARLEPKGFIIKPSISEGNSSILYLLNNPNLNCYAVAHVFKIPSIQDKKEVKAKLDALVGLRHRNIIKVIDYDLDSFPFFMVTDYIHGPNLTEAIKSTGRRTQFQAADWLFQLTDALNYLRHKRIFHSNVRPSKLFIDEDGQIMLSPLDVHLIDQERATYKRFLDIIKYESPKEFENFNPDLPKPEEDTIVELKNRELSDQYSIGLIGFKILTGVDLFDGETVHELAKSRRKFEEDSEYRTKKLSALPEFKEIKIADEEFSLKIIFDKLLQRDEKKRYESLHELQRNLHPFTRTTYIGSNKAWDSYRRCLANNKEFISDFYEEFFKSKPNAQSAFDDKSGKRQRVMLQLAIDILFDIEARKDLFTKILYNTHHQKYELSDFKLFIGALIKTIKNNDPKWESDPEIAEAWAKLKAEVIDFIASHKTGKDSKPLSGS